MKKITKLLFSSINIILAFSPLTSFAENKDYGLSDTVNSKIMTSASAFTKNSDLQGSIGRLIGYALSFVGTIFFLLIVYAGFKWMTAAGNEKQAGEAKELIIQAIIGLIIIFSAYIVTAYIGGIIAG